MLNENAVKYDEQGELEQLEATIAQARERAQQILRDAESTAALVKQAQLARGTREVPPLVLEPEQTLEQRVVDALLERSLSVTGLTRVVGEPAGPVQAVLKDLRSHRRVHNVGTADEPRWTLVVGDDVGTDVLYPLVERLVRDQPMTTAQLVAATGARETRVSGAVIHLQRSRDGMLNLGTRGTGRWFLIPEGVQLARLSPKRVRR